MRWSIVCLAALPVAVSAYDFSHVVKRASDFTFDLFHGPELQDTTSGQPPDKLEYTTGGGVPYPNPYEAQRIGQKGPLLLQDFHLIESLAHFDRERIPERVVHAKGAGAHGYFETTTNFAKQYSMADLFQQVGQKTPITMRFSTVGGEKGSGDVVRDPRGFAIKLRTNKGILDWVFNNTPVFFLRDPAKFPNFIHTQKRNPETNLKDKEMFWDYLSSNPESLYQVMRLFSDLGTPNGFRYMNGWSGHTYRLVKPDDSWVYVKVQARTDQGIRNHTNLEAVSLAGSNPDFGTQDLFEAIADGNYPSWTVYFQVMTPEQAEGFKYNVLDLTKDWDFDVPYNEVGRLVLTQNPKNFFAEIEQAAFSPSHTVDGWEPSADPVLQARLFSYPDTHRYRLGVNYQQIPVNCPFAPVANFQRDGFMNVDGNQGSRPNYPSTVEPLNLPTRAYDDSNHTIWTGGAVRYLSQISPIDFDLPNRFWTNLTQQDQDNLVSNVVGHLSLVKSETIRKRQATVFASANKELGQRIADGIKVTLG